MTGFKRYLNACMSPFVDNGREMTCGFVDKVHTFYTMFLFVLHQHVSHLSTSCSGQLSELNIDKVEEHFLIFKKW